MSTRLRPVGASSMAMDLPRPEVGPVTTAQEVIGPAKTQREVGEVNIFSLDKLSKGSEHVCIV
jgi:hypothetical protein